MLRELCTFPELTVSTQRLRHKDDCKNFLPSASCTLSVFGHGWGSQGQHKAKPVGFIFSHTFQLNGNSFGVVIEAHYTTLFLRVIFVVMGNNHYCAVSKTQTLDCSQMFIMYSDSVL